MADILVPLQQCQLRAAGEFCEQCAPSHYGDATAEHLRTASPSACPLTEQKACGALAQGPKWEGIALQLLGESGGTGEGGCSRA